MQDITQQPLVSAAVDRAPAGLAVFDEHLRYLHVNAGPDTIDLTLRVDTHRVSPDDLDNCLRGIEELVVAAALPG